MRCPVGGLTEHVDDLDGARHGLASARSTVQLRLDEIRVHVPRAGLGVDEDDVGTEVGHRVGRADEGEVGDEDLVARPHACQSQGDVQRRGAAGDGDGVAGTDGTGELLLELGHLRPDGGDEPGIESRQHCLSLGCTQVRRRERDGSRGPRCPGGAALVPDAHRWYR